MIVALYGPTSSGKTSLSISLAKSLNAEIINCDLISFYKGMDIGSAKVTEEEMEGVKHHFISFLDISREYTIYDYQKEARKLLDKLISENKNIIICGGSGLYLKALLYDYKFIEEEKFKEPPLKEMIDILKENNITVDYQNERRVVRAYQRYMNGVESEVSLPKYNFIGISLDLDREKLYELINKRVDIMLDKGLIKEVEALRKENPSSKILHKAIGYKEIISFLDGNISLNEAKDLIAKNTRHLAKRQLTFNRGQLGFKTFDALSLTLKDDVLKYIMK